MLRGSTTATRSGSKDLPTGASHAPRPTAIEWGTAPRRTSTCCCRGCALAQGLLKPTGTIWIQVDWRANYLVARVRRDLRARPLLERDRVASRAEPRAAGPAGNSGARSTRSSSTAKRQNAPFVPPERLEPIAARRRAQRRAMGRPSRSRRAATTPTRRSHASNEGGRVHRTATGRVSIKYWLENGAREASASANRSTPCGSTSPRFATPQADERTGYPTQKPRALLERIIARAPRPEAWSSILCGVGHDAEAAAAHLGRRFILGDASPVAIATMRSRLLRDGVRSLRVERCGRLRGAGIDCGARANLTASAKCASRYLRPGEEPVAWAIEPRTSAGPFRPVWHAERARAQGRCTALRRRSCRAERARARVASFTW